MHRDLAARNILVSRDEVCKVSVPDTKLTCFLPFTTDIVLLLLLMYIIHEIKDYYGMHNNNGAVDYYVHS